MAKPTAKIVAKMALLMVPDRLVHNDCGPVKAKTSFWHEAVRHDNTRGASRGCAVRLLTEYLDRAVQLERLASSETETAFKEQLLKQAAAYRKLAAKRAEEYGLPPPSPPEAGK